MAEVQTDTRNRILEASWKLLESEQGQMVRMSDIAKLAGISRQAIYLHFTNRTDLFIATTRYVEQVKGTDARLAASRAATSGVARLDAFIEGWGNFIPEIYGVARSLMLLQATDEAAATAWKNRMDAFREGCEAAVGALAADKKLSSMLTKRHATDLLFVMLSVEGWEKSRFSCGWSQREYIKLIKIQAHAVLLDL